MSKDSERRFNVEQDSVEITAKTEYQEPRFKVKPSAESAKAISTLELTKQLATLAASDLSQLPVYNSLSIEMQMAVDLWFTGLTRQAIATAIDCTTLQITQWYLSNATFRDAINERRAMIREGCTDIALANATDMMHNLVKLANAGDRQACNDILKLANIQPPPPGTQVNIQNNLSSGGYGANQAGSSLQRQDGRLVSNEEDTVINISVNLSTHNVVNKEQNAPQVVNCDDVIDAELVNED